MSNTTSSLFDLRVQKLQQQLPSNQVIILSNPSDVQYFSGFDILVPEEKEAVVILTRQTIILQHAIFSPAEVELTCQKHSGCQPDKIAQTIAELVKNERIAEIIIDETALSVNEYKALLPLQATLLPLDRSLIWNIRMIKDETEINHLKQAGTIASRAFSQVVGPNGNFLQAGMTELELKKQLEAQLLKLGSEKPAFPTIIAFGSNGALPHHQPTNQKLSHNMPVLIDFGATVNSYRSDMTRSFWFGDQPEETFAHVAQVVTAAYQAATQEINPSVTAQQVDSAARQTIAEAGFGSNFIHTTGHGVGLDIHEQPSLNSTNQQPIKPHMVITVEPGVYLPDKFGYRFENTILVTDNGFEQLTYA